MDGNGNKVQTLRQQFEVLSYNDHRLSKSKSTSNFAEIMGEADALRNMIIRGNRNGFLDVPLASSKYHVSDSRDDPLIIHPEEGIYVSNSITLHNMDPEEDEKIMDYPSLSTNTDDLSIDQSEGQQEKNGNFNDNTSQSSATAYGKVKRSNAFRKKDVVDSADARLPKAKTKLTLERVKSLDNNNVPGSGQQKKHVDAEVNRASSVYVRSAPSNHHHHHHHQQQLQQKAINVVAPYQVSEIYAHAQRNNNQTLHQEMGQYQQKQFLEGDYAVPVVSRHDRYSTHGEYAPPIPPPPDYIPQMIPSCQSTDRPLSVGRDNHSGHQIKEAKTKSTTPASNNNVLPPEKPPRTFLYDILSDNTTTQYQHHQRPLLTPNHPNNANLQRIRNGFYYPSSSSTTALYQPGDSSKHRRPQNTSENAKQGTTDVKTATTTPGGGKATINVKKNGPHRSSQNHQTLVRSKTESQIIVKNKNRTWENSMLGGLETRSSNMMKNSNNNNSAFPSGLSANYNDYNAHVHQLGPNLRVAGLAVGSSGNVHTHHGLANAQYGVITSSENFGGNVVGSSGVVGGLGRSSLSQYTDGMTNLPSHGLMATVVNNNNTNKNGKGINVNRCRSDDRLCEKSKSEWALHQVLNGSDGGGGGGISGGRRNTVANTVGSSNTTSQGNNIHHTGHPSLESNGSSNNSTKLFRSSIQHSIQNLMNQLFSTSAVNGKDATSSTDSGIQLGSESLSSCDTPVGDSTTDTGDSDIENEVETSSNARQVVEARKGYIRQVSSFRVKELGTMQNRLISNCKKPQNGEALFECLLVVGLNRDTYTGTYHPYIKEMFPSNTKLAAGVEQFCFPDSLEWPCHEGVTAQSYTLAITDHRGGRKYGCCFRILPEGANMCIPITYCLISSNRAIGFYREVLKEVTLRHGCSEYHKRYWMEQLYNKPFPPPDGDVCIQEPISEETYVMSTKSNVSCYSNVSYVQPKMVTIRRKADHRLDDQDLVSLLTKLDVTTVIKIFGSMLHERKVVLISRALSTLSLCLEALESMLYPFTWQHTFIPILPLNMPDILDAPSPFLIGVLKSSQSAWEKNFDDGIIVDLDTNKIIRCVGDEGTILPKRIHHKLRDALQCVLHLSDQGESTKNVLFSECFIRMFVDVLGHYGGHIILQADGVKIFDRETFIKSTDTKATQNFLDWFSETSMFQFFIDSRLKNNFKHGVFEQRIMGDSANQNYGAHFPFKNSKTQKNNRTFGINWLKDAFVMKS